MNLNPQKVILIGKKLVKSILETNSIDWWFQNKDDDWWVNGGKESG